MKEKTSSYHTMYIICADTSTGLATLQLKSGSKFVIARLVGILRPPLLFTVSPKAKEAMSPISPIPMCASNVHSWLDLEP